MVTAEEYEKDLQFVRDFGYMLSEHAEDGNRFAICDDIDAAQRRIAEYQAASGEDKRIEISNTVDTLQTLSTDNGYYGIGPDGGKTEQASMLTGGGLSLMYAGKQHVLYAARDTGKTTLATVGAAQELLAGNHVLWFDFEGQKSQLIERLMNLGVDEDSIYDRFHHYDMPGAGQIATLVDLAGQLNDLAEGSITMAVADAARGLAGSIAPDVRDNLGHDVAAVERAFTKPLMSAGIAVLILTHEAGGTAFGSQHWESSSDVVLRMTSGESFSRDKDGYARIHVVRDRMGYLTAGQHAANLEVSEQVPEVVPVAVKVPVAEATGTGTLVCPCGKSKRDKRAARCKACSNRSTADKRERDESGRMV
jgi:hypothetical protein